MQKIKQQQKINTAIPFGKSEKWQRVLRPIILVVAIGLWIAGASVVKQRLFLSLVCLVISMYEMVWSAVIEFQSKKGGGYLLSSLSLVISFLAGFHLSSSAAAIILFVGYWLTATGHESAGKDMQFFDGLLHLRGRMYENGRYTFRDSSLLTKGMIIEVFPGETVPADGIVVSEGKAILDYSSWLHRQKTVQVSQGSVVYCGALNHGQPITIKVTASGSFTLAQKMRAGVCAALKQKSTVQIVLGKVLPFYSLIMITAALIAGVFVPLFGGSTWSRGASIAAGMLLVAGVWDVMESINLAFVAGVGAMCRRGVMFKSCRQIMLLRRITDMIFSKTGTLTERNLRVEEIVPHNDYTKEQVLNFAATAEQVSDHLIAAAILKEAGDISLPTPQHQLVIPGEGVCVEAEGKRIYVGNDLLMRRAGVQVLPYHGLGIICFVAVEDTYIGCLILHDPLKFGAAKTLDGLFSCGIRSIDLITGDKKNNAESVGAALGIHRVFAELSKKAKMETVKRNARKGKYGGRIAFVGDETDAECLRAADISFAIKTVEGSVEGSAGDIVVMSDDPMGVLQSFHLSFKLRRLFTILLIFSFTIKIALFFFLCYGLLPLWAVAIVESGLRLFGIYLAASCRKIS